MKRDAATLQRLDFEACDLKAIGDDAPAGTFEGYASIFGVVDQGGDVVEKGAFAESLDQASRQGRTLPMLWQHDRAEPIGVWENVTEDSKGLKVRGRLLVDDDPLAKRAWAHLKAGSIGGLSIGYRVLDAAPHPKKKNAISLLKVDLREISLVTMPMLIQARVTGVKEMLAAGQMPTVRDFEAFLRDEAGFTNSKAKHIAGLAAPALLRDSEDERDQGDVGTQVLVAMAKRMGLNLETI